jgi:hypothetical protein
MSSERIMVSGGGVAGESLLCSRLHLPAAEKSKRTLRCYGLGADSEKASGMSAGT